MSEEINGVKIQKLPTVGKPLTLKGSRFRPTGLEFKTKNKKEKNKLLQIRKAISEKDEK